MHALTKDRSPNGKPFGAGRLHQHRRKLLTIGAVQLLFLPLGVHAGGVVTNCTEAALRAAVAGGGTVTFACDSTFRLASTITNNLNLTLDGSGHEVRISGGSAVRVFAVNTNVTSEHPGQRQCRPSLSPAERHQFLQLDTHRD
jgi:hypothetical protein